MSDTKELLQHAINQKPSEFADTFNSILLNKLQTAVADRKMELAQNIVADPVVDNETEQEVEVDDTEELEPDA